MLFNSFSFFIFLLITFAGYWLICYPRNTERVPHYRIWLQNLFVVIASYVFYGWLDWRFLLLIAFTSLWTFFSGVLLGNVTHGSIRARFIVIVSLIVNFGILGVFKYCNFFLDQVVAILNVIGVDAHPVSLKIILPVGISFYTFCALGYVIDVYKEKITPTRDIIEFFAFVSFFPQLLAGPIARATSLLPQFQHPRKFSYPLAVEGCRQMLWGFAKKILVADNCAYAANAMLNNPDPSTISVWIAMFCFAFQIYGDFSGYSDIAIGCSKLFGIRLMKNFDKPYFARNIAEFWRRWHISLTTWFRDYLYIPLGGSRCGLLKKIRNTFAIFLVSGFWHGANWTFIIWGAFHAFCFLPLMIAGKNRKYAKKIVAKGRMWPSFSELWRMLLTFGVVVVGWTFFRAPDFQTALDWLEKMFLCMDFRYSGVNLSWCKTAIPFIFLLAIVEWFNRSREIPALPRSVALRWMVYILIIFAMGVWQAPSETFIYFQF